MGTILVGTASWTDPSLIGCRRFYPADARTAEDRLRFYATQFPIVEVDSTYYGMPAEKTASLWAERTPDGFTFNIKSFALFTHHPAQPRSLPKDIREALPQHLLDKRHIYYSDVPAELRDALWERFHSALLPLAATGRLGVVLFQFPPWFLPGRESFDHLDALPERVPGYTPAVEFRAPAWLDEEHVEETLRFLSERGLPYVAVDEPQGTHASVPPVTAVTAPVAVVRFHGRNRAAWAKRGGDVAEKYDYLYDGRELGEWAPRILRMAEEARVVHVLMNNCREDKAVVNARQISLMLNSAPPPAPAPAPPEEQPRLL